MILSYKNKYINYSSVYTPAAEFKRQVERMFSNSPSLTDITINNSITPTKAIIVEGRSVLQKKLFVEVSQTLKNGDTITFNNTKWIATDYEEIANAYKRAILESSLGMLKFINEHGVIVSYPFAIKREIASSELDDTRIIVLGKDKRSIIVQSNNDTIKIKKGQRFIFDDVAWAVASVNKLIQGIVTLELEETQINNVTDNLTLGVADYTIKNVYQLKILNGSSINTTTGQFIQLNTEVRLNDEIVTSPLTYQSSNSAIATVSNSGLITPIANGNATITVRLSSEPSVLRTIELVVENIVVQNNVSLQILGRNSLKLTQQTTYTFSLTINGQVVSENGVWTVLGVNDIPTSLVMNSSLSNVLTLTANNSQVGQVKISVTTTSGHTATRTIDIVPLF